MGRNLQILIFLLIFAKISASKIGNAKFHREIDQTNTAVKPELQNLHSLIALQMAVYETVSNRARVIDESAFKALQNVFKPSDEASNISKFQPDRNEVDDFKKAIAPLYQDFKNQRLPARTRNLKSGKIKIRKVFGPALEVDMMLLNHVKKEAEVIILSSKGQENTKEYRLARDMEKALESYMNIFEQPTKEWSINAFCEEKVYSNQLLKITRIEDKQTLIMRNLLALQTAIFETISVRVKSIDANVFQTVKDVSISIRNQLKLPRKEIDSRKKEISKLYRIFQRILSKWSSLTHGKVIRSLAGLSVDMALLKHVKRESEHVLRDGQVNSLEFKLAQTMTAALESYRAKLKKQKRRHKEFKEFWSNKALAIRIGAFYNEKLNRNYKLKVNGLNNEKVREVLTISNSPHEINLHQTISPIAEEIQLNKLLAFQLMVLDKYVLFMKKYPSKGKQDEEIMRKIKEMQEKFGQIINQGDIQKRLVNCKAEIRSKLKEFKRFLDHFLKGYLVKLPVEFKKFGMEAFDVAVIDHVRKVYKFVSDKWIKEWAATEKFFELRNNGPPEKPKIQLAMQIAQILSKWSLYNYSHLEVLYSRLDQMLVPQIKKFFQEKITNNTELNIF